MRRRRDWREKIWNIEISFMEEVYLIDICVDFKVGFSSESQYWMNSIGIGVWYVISLNCANGVRNPERITIAISIMMFSSLWS